MTSSTEPDGVRPKKRRKKKKRRAEQPVAAAPPQSKLPPKETAGRAFVFLLVALAAAVFYVRVAPNDTNRPFALAAVGVASFLCGASGGVDPQRTVVLFGAMVAVGLAIVGIDSNEVGTALAMAGGLGLGGAIHRLGRQGPDEGTFPQTAAVSGPTDEPVREATDS